MARMHHMSIRTANIHRAIAFYEKLGFCVGERFTTGITLACWLEGLGGRIELVQVPLPHSTADAFGDEHYTGYYHLSFDLTDEVDSLPTWLNQVKQRFSEGEDDNMAISFTVLLPPTQQIIGDSVYEVAFLADADGLPLEFIRVLGPAPPASG
ncbi:MAG: VOC family protein [Leptolyngbyaceae bacterium]|nr:VOC family protein [Leptolyngbyaceae bacterium]